MTTTTTACGAVPAGAERVGADDAGRLLGRLPGVHPRGLHAWIYASSRPGAGSTTGTCSTSVASTSSASHVTSKTAAGPGDRRPPAVHGDRVLPLRRGRRRHRAFAGGAHPSAPHRLRVPRRPSRPQRARRHLGRRRRVVGEGSRTGVAARVERVASVRGDRRRHRRTRPRVGFVAAGTPDTCRCRSSYEPHRDRTWRDSRIVQKPTSRRQGIRETHPTRPPTLRNTATSLPHILHQGNMCGVENEGESERVRGTDVIEGVVRCRTGGSSLVPAVAVTRRNDGDQPIHDQGT